ncbi:MAG: SCP2 sterol-binding domain-containing protein [Candidatus Caldarchaeum sp.]
MKKKFVLGSRGWVEAFVNVLNSDPEYQSVAKDWEDPIVILMTGLPPKLREYFQSDAVGCWFDLYHGRCRSFELVKSIDEKPAPIVLYGMYENMKKIAMGKVNPTIAVVTGQVKVKGNMAKLLSNAGASSAFVNALKKVSTEFLA